MSVASAVRHAELGDLVALLNRQQAAKVDVVAPASALRARGGLIEVSGVDPVFDERGVTTVEGAYRPTGAADTQIGSKLKIPVGYLKWLREQGRSDLYDANVNGLLHGPDHPLISGSPEDRSFLLRLFTSGAPGEPGVLRAFLSDRYGIIDNLDVLTAVLDGIRAADTDVAVRACDLTETSMHCKVYSPKVSALAPSFLANYRNPFANPELEAERRRAAGELERWRPVAAREGQGFPSGSEPVLFAGFRFSNSEIGRHAVTLKPELLVQVCRNGLTLPMFAFTKRHLGDKLDIGVAGSWSQDTYRKRLAVITAETRDKVSEWLSPQFLAARVAEIERHAATPVAAPDKTIEVVAKKLGFSQDERSGILSHFIAAGQLTAAGIANAVTSYSQTIPDADRADTLDDLALHAMTLV
ncbi:hypothetical protein FEK35_20690 [Nocardia cyriacigeorgica]|uniref:DUF932 domain-containing protein n=1 Tax=Nocardia cyriacigeorgica TaxID=135487 RepID=A0A5R8PAY3_9NOCA|nr:hypothetical protein [Nocardia cyriacigeorgica]TLG04249.1 hypothetical protein FEK35_20690 [Nocardia cyriacigeorgica]